MLSPIHRLLWLASNMVTFLRWRVFSTSPNPPSWRITPCRLSATAYSVYSQLPSIGVSEVLPPSAAWGHTISSSSKVVEFQATRFVASDRQATFISKICELRKEAKLSLSTPWRHRGGGEVQLHSFVTSALDRVEGSSCPCHFILFGRAPVAIEQGACWATGPVWTFP